MAHVVKFDIPRRDLGRADISFWVMKDQATLGELRVSNGSLVWFPKGKGKGHKMSWSEFDADAQKYPRVEKR